MSKKKYNIFYATLVLLPVLIIIGFELILQALDYGYNYSTFISFPNQFENYKFFNPNLPKKYFGNSKVTPSVIADGFAENKSKNTFRIFALGGSTTAGFPHPPNGSFPRMLKNMLVAKYPDINFEIINLGVSAINSITIRDIIDQVLNEEPDLILIYAGHNEYYGALGPASSIAGFYSQKLIRFLLDIKKFKIVQLTENLVSNLSQLFSNEEIENGTLMSKMSGNNLVSLNSETYYRGVEQFDENLNYILKKCEEQKIQVMLGTLASNLYQAPLCRYSGCDSLTLEFNNSLLLENEDKKNRLEQIKDQDQLRFRAPEEFNKIIKKYAKKYKNQIFDVKHSFEKNSQEGVVGDELLMDHLHPTIKGNNIIADVIFENMENNKVVKHLLRLKKSKSLYRFKRIPTYTKLDSSFADLRITYLKNDFPFSPNKKNRLLNKKLSCIEDSIADEIISGKISWEDAHLKMADYYLEVGDVQKFLEEYNVLIEDKPFDKFPYLNAIKSLEKTEEIELLKTVLLKYHKQFPDFYSSLKLGDIYYKQKYYREAIYFYELCDSYNKKYSQIYFNLSACYFALKDVKKAVTNIENCINIDPDYPNAKKIQSNLMKFSKNL